MEFETLELEEDDRGVVTLWLNRAEKHNAMSGQMIAELSEAAKFISTCKARVVVLASRGPSFCAGGDLKWMRAQINADGATRAVEARKLAMMLFAWNTLPQPVIGRIHGNAFGGGVGLACICDSAIGMEGAKFGLTETKLGLIPATIGPYVIARMGEARARRVFMSSRIFGADEAKNLGILANVVNGDDLDAAVEAEIAPYLKCAPGAVGAAKQLARQLGPKIDAETIDASISALVTRWESEEASTGIAAFFDKAPPPWAT